MPDLHDIDAVGRTRRDLDELTTDLTAGPLELMALNRRNDVTLDAAHSHAKCQKLQCESLTCTGSTAHGQVGVLVDLRIEEINDTQGVVVAIDAQQDAGVIRHLKAREHIGRSRPAGQDIPLALSQKLGTDLQERHDTAQGCFLLEPAFAQVHIHGLEHIDHLLLAPLKLLIGLGRYGDEHRHIEEVFIVVGNAVFDVIACLNGIGQLLVVGTGILHSLQLRPVQADPLSNLVDGLTAVFPLEVNVNINALTGIDQAGHPAAPDGSGVSVASNEEKAEVSAVHDDVVMMGQIQTSGGNEMRDGNMGYRIHAHDPILSRHGIHHHPVGPVCKRLIHAGTAIEEHIKDLRRGNIRVLRLKDGVAALEKICPGILLGSGQHTVDLAIVVRLTAADGLILENQEEAPGQRLSGTDILDQTDVVLAQSLALLIFLGCHLLADHSDMLVRVCLSGNALELEPHGRDLQPAGKGRENVELLLRRSEHEIDGFDLKDLDVTAIRGLHDAVTDLLDREERLDEFKLFRLSSFFLCAPVF